MTGFSCVVVFSHLRWDWVYQRPQHLLARMARGGRVLFIEEPITDPAATTPFWEFQEPAPGVRVCRPHTPVTAPGYCDAQLPLLAGLLDELVVAEQLRPEQYVVWLYTPLALPLARQLQPSAVVYDCMDELSGFKGAPAELRQREEQLFAWADLVFTGGPSLYEAKRTRHPDVHCFPSSLDAAHFGQARGAAPEPAEQAALPRPRLGFFGVIDERIDLALLDALARHDPGWQIVMVGPVTKIDPDSLPRHPNLHYFGKRAYEELPGFLGGWDVCLLPFARNDATRYISPTKTLEYMAAEKPIVSTPIHDVAAPYGDIVHLGDTPAEFVAACARALESSDTERAARVAKMRGVLARTSWDATVARMTTLIEAAIRRRAGGNRPAAAPAPGGAEQRRGLVIVGAGPTGLSAAYHAGQDAVLLEAGSTVGGWCRSIHVDGFTFDYAGHIMFSNDPYVHELYQKLLGDNVHWQDREAWIYSKGVYTRYPFQGALYGLPPDVIRECIVGAIEARYGPLRAAHGKGGNGNGHGHGGNGHGRREAGQRDATAGGPARPGAEACDRVADCCADGVLESTAPLARAGAPGGNGDGPSLPENFEEFIYRVWGAGIARHFAIPYNRKLWAVPLTEMETSWLGGRVPQPDLEELIEGALSPVPKPMGPNARFGYPLRGGFQALMNGFLPHVADRLWLDAEVVAISPARRQVQLRDGRRLTYEQLVSTMPLPRLVRILGDEAPASIRAAARALRHVSVRCVHLGVGREQLTEKHWIYYPEDPVFHRIFVQGNASPHCNRPGGFGLTCEITYGPNKPLPCDGAALVQRCIDDCRKVGILRAEDPVWASAQVDMPYAYVVYDHARARNVKLIRDWLAARDIHLAGRYSEWEYYNSDHAFLAGKRVIDGLRSRPARPVAAPRVASDVKA